MKRLKFKPRLVIALSEVFWRFYERFSTKSCIAISEQRCNVINSNGVAVYFGF